jgi:dihydroorotate dehydrogenase (NAD+) catalytic subunit
MTGKVDLSTSVGPLQLKNPVMTASGTSGHGAELACYFDLSELGALVVKSIAARPFPGNPAPRVAAVPSLPGAMLNSVGLQGEGVSLWAERHLPDLEAAGCPVVVSLWGRTVAEFEEAAAALRTALSAASSPAVVAVEVNVSCPNIEDRSRMFAHSATATGEAVAACKAAGLPLVAKMSPNTAELLEIAAAALAAGAVGLTLVNTLLALSLDTSTRRSPLGAGGGGLSGPPLHPVALRAVHECRVAFPGTGIVGVGGVADGDGALRMLLAGADAVQVGTATFADPRAPLRVLGGLAEALEQVGASSAREVVGAAELA